MSLKFESVEFGEPSYGLELCKTYVIEGVQEERHVLGEDVVLFGSIANVYRRDPTISFGQDL